MLRPSARGSAWGAMPSSIPNAPTAKCNEPRPSASARMECQLAQSSPTVWSMRWRKTNAMEFGAGPVSENGEKYRRIDGVLKKLPPLLARRLDPQEDCLIWQGPLDKDGYGLVALPQSQCLPGHGRTWRVHRLVFLLITGELPEEQLHHVCENKRCAWPGHLAPKTPKEHKAEHGPSGLGAVRAAMTHCSRCSSPLEWVQEGGRTRRRCRPCRRQRDRQRSRSHQ